MTEYFTIALIALFAAISPGPDFVIIAKNALSYNRYSAIMTSAGIGLGIIIHASYCVLGLAIIISHSILLFSVIKYLGATYLVYIGIKSLIDNSGHTPIKAKITTKHSKWIAFKDGLITNVFNPKCTLFILSVFTLVVRPHTPTIVQVTYGVEIALITFAWFVFLAYVLTTATIRSRIEKTQRIATKLIGGILITIGIAVMFESR